MGRLIDANKVDAIFYRHGVSANDCVGIYEDILDLPTVEAIPKDQYEARLKADMVAMLTEIQLEIEELCINNPLSEDEEDMNRGIEEDDKVKNPMKQTLDFLKNLYLQNKEEIDRVAKEYKVIEKEQTTKNDLGVDCISRVEVIDYLCKHCPDDGECFKDCDEIKHLRQMPSVTPQEPKTGHWINGEYCSECGCDVPAYIVDWKWQKDMDAKYCPNCGCAMVEPQESEDNNGSNN